MGVSIQIASVFYCVLVMVSFFIKKKKKSIENSLFGMMIVGNFCGLFLDIVSYFCAMTIGDTFITLFLCRLILVYLILWILTMTVYIVAISFGMKYEEKETNQKKWAAYTKFKQFVILFEIIVCGLAFVLPLDVIIEKNYAYSTGTASYIIYVISAILITIWMISLIFNRKTIKVKKLVPLFAYMTLGGSVALLQYYNPSIIVMIPMETFITILMYFTIENPDVKMIEQLDSAKAAAEKANHAKSDFLSSMSHEIRTPLNAIVGFSDCILEEDTLEAAKNDAKDIKLASENLLEIVNGILDISKIEADKMEIVETDYNLRDVLENIGKLVKPRIGDKPIQLNTLYAPDLPFMVHGDGGKLRQVITNILTNAIKYTEKGEITYSVNCINTDDRCDLIISVEDTGRGIKPEQIDKLFTKFQRLDEDKNTTLEGTGLGLAITKRFVEMMGGKIVVQSKYGEGSKFTVYISQKIVERDHSEERLVEDLNKINDCNKADFSSKKILVVDDNKINIKVALKLLSQHGIEADSCESGFDCLDKVKETTYDLILLDDMMPKMTGSETLVKLHEIEGYNTPTVALTANAITGMKEQYLEAGFTDYLSKPIDKVELERVLKEYLK